MAKKPRTPRPQKRTPPGRRRRQRSQAISANSADLPHGSLRSAFNARIHKRLGNQVVGVG